MKLMNRYPPTNGAMTLTVNACLTSCRKIIAQVAKAKDAIFAEARGRLQAQERLLRLALNEAEALAWQTTVPHLVFPILATEKIQAVADWNNHQQSLRHGPAFSAGAHAETNH